MRKMKDSGVDWIGDIPEGWELSKIKYCCKNIGSGTTPTSGHYEFYDGDFNWIQSGDLYQKSIILNTDKTVTRLAINTHSALKIYPHDYVVLAMYGASVGNVAIAKISACVNQACCVLIQNEKYNIQYLYYWITHCKEDLIQQSSGGGQPNISQQKIKNELILFLPLPEQNQIANHLDTKCAEIDSILADTKLQIEILEQYKKSVITEAVTKGLDKNAKMKDSGIEWIGEIPEGWVLNKLKYIFSIKKAKLPEKISELKDESNMVYLTMDYIRDNSIAAVYGNNGTYVAADDILLLWDGSNAGEMIFNHPSGYAPSTTAILKSKYKEDRYLKYVLKVIEIGLKQQTIGMGIPHVNSLLLKGYAMCEPSITEQNQIANYLDTKCAEIEATIQDKQQLMATLEEYKKSIIFEYVTGKRQVV